ncbi:YbaB/EbfC family nucleoid-associated protein [Mycolicibacter sinensis]|uniref:Uncharacterized protein n=1 Tax=Mycolicibacter sinensis (strain JDM601) TaxID=875328 RepID=A0A1A2P0Q3_MYCSD|nr:YbaB/EbfC family nucleoid-associated protein [Mycolicibacter sinensis]OBH20918.1 hypothetical protein A5694_14640 [Mycolicibacter sinensis]OBI33605.1 hypothetical protein A5710_13270 [Mycolicibacter sinensis]
MLPDPEVARVVAQLRAVRSLLERASEQSGKYLFVATDSAGTVEASVNAQRRLVDLRILDDRIMNLGAHDVTERINEAMWAASDFAAVSADQDLSELEQQIAAALTESDET